MSRISEKSPKDCAAKQSPHKLNKKLIIYLSTLSLTLLTCMLLVWLNLYPSKPEFSVSRAHVDRLNSSILLTILSHNPNKNAGIYYDQISVHASYKGQKNAPLFTDIVPFYQECEATSVLSADLVGDYQVQNDQRAGNLGLNVEIIGKLRWKVGNWKSGVHGFSVNCYIMITFGARFSSGLSYVQGMECSTTV